MDQTSALAFKSLITSDLKKITEVLLGKQKQVVIIGGAVRDFFFNKPITDIDFDIATNATPDEVARWMKESGFKVKFLGEKYGTLLVIIGKKAFEVSTYRREIFESLGKPPKVYFVDRIEDDLERRDFKFNAIVFDINNQRFIDKFNGLGDIRELRISTIGNAEKRLREDGLRIIRLARFYSNYNLIIDEDLLEACRRIGKDTKFRNSVALRNEFFKLLQSSTPALGLKLLIDNQILNAIFPSFPLMKLESEKRPQIFEIIDRFDEIPRRTIMVRLFALLIVLKGNLSLTNNILEQVSVDLKLSKKDITILIRILHSWISFPKDLGVKELKRWIRATGINTSEDLLHLIFLYAELTEDTKLMETKNNFFKEVQRIINKLRFSGELIRKEKN